nr:MAG TPA: hypothetical protein [Caudoviricetes sp.]
MKPTTKSHRSRSKPPAWSILNVNNAKKGR